MLFQKGSAPWPGAWPARALSRRWAPPLVVEFICHWAAPSQIRVGTFPHWMLLRNRCGEFAAPFRRKGHLRLYRGFGFLEDRAPADTTVAGVVASFPTLAQLEPRLASDLGEDRAMLAGTSPAHAGPWRRHASILEGVDLHLREHEGTASIDEAWGMKCICDQGAFLGVDDRAFDYAEVHCERVDGIVTVRRSSNSRREAVESIIPWQWAAQVGQASRSDELCRCRRRSRLARWGLYSPHGSRISCGPRVLERMKP